LLNEADAIQVQGGNTIGAWWTTFTRSEFYLEMGDLDKARRDAEQSNALAEQIGLFQYRIKSKRRLAEVAAASGDHKRAYALSVESAAMSDEAKNIQLSQRMLDLAQRYRKESAQRRLSELERRSERQQAELHQRAIRQQWLFVVLVLSLAALLITGYLLLRLRRSNRLLEEINASLEQSRNELRKQRGILQSVLDSMGDGVAVADEAGEYLLLNPVAERFIGKLKNIGDEQDRSRRYGFFLSDQATHYPMSQLPLSKAIRGESCDHVELFLRNASNPDGSWLSVTARPLVDKAGFAKGGVAVFSDITSSKQAQRQMELTARVFEQSAEGIIIFNTDKNILSVNPAFCQMTGYKPEELLGCSLDAVQYIERADQYTDHIWNSIWQHVDREGYWQGEIREQRSDGEIFPVFLSVSVVFDERGKIINYIGINRDITQHKEAEAHIHQLAYYDALTELPNRFLLNDRIEQAISQAHREMRAVTLMFLDLDRFKNINDSLGHRVGDGVLVETARRLDSMKRGEDTVSRLGGDEFILLFPNTDSDGAAHIARKIINLLSEPFRIGNHELMVTPSIGISIFPIDGESPEALIQNADSAMYRAKQDGRSTFRFFTQAMYLRANRMLKLENALRNALSRQELSLHYQPQVDIQSGSIIGCEALLRWKHPEYGMVSPMEFVPIAEDSGQILQIGEWVLQTALEQIKSWEKAGFPLLPISVNLSVVQFRQINLIEKIRQILKETGVPPEYLELELTESITMEEPVIAINIMNRLHQCGIKLSIDDFGTGYSSLSYLKRFNLNRLKIDRSFIQDITVDPEDEEIVKTIIGLARSLKLRTIAEGVETREQMLILKMEGCDEIQGYYYSKPLPSDEFAELLHAEQQKKGGKVEAGKVKAGHS
jgi:diguanylate cyclase (GGDEF)-like protein/PAS domain S-box-containing protein